MIGACYSGLAALYKHIMCLEPGVELALVAEPVIMLYPIQGIGTLIFHTKGPRVPGAGTSYRYSYYIEK